MVTKLAVLLFGLICISIFAFTQNQTKENGCENAKICDLCISPGDKVILYRLTGDTIPRLKFRDLCSSNKYVELRLQYSLSGDSIPPGDTTSVAIPQEFTIKEIKLGSE